MSQELHSIPMYKAFGLHIQSEIPLPELPTLPPASIQAPQSAEPIDLYIGYADLASQWASYSPTGAYINTPDTFMLRIEGLALFACKNGNRIQASPEPGADPDQLRLYLLGTCMGAILLQRRILPLHGSAIAIDGRAYAIVGHSGHGKSTLASALLQQGYRLLTDDVIPVSRDASGTFQVTPAYPQQKLWQESLDVFGMSTSEYRPLFERETKFAVPVTSSFVQDTLPLAGIFELIKADCNDLMLQETSRLERLSLLSRHTYRSSLLEGCGLTSWHFDITARLASQVDMYRVWRPMDQQTIHSLRELVLDRARSVSAAFSR